VKKVLSIITVDMGYNIRKSMISILNCGLISFPLLHIKIILRQKVNFIVYFKELFDINAGEV
jgi:hypothetical protein